MEINGEPRPLPPIPKLVQPKLYELEDEYEKVHVEHEYADVQDSIGSESNKSFNPERGPMPVPRSVDLYDKICTENSESTENHTQKEPDRPVENKKIKFAMLSKEKRSISNLYEEMDFKMNQKLDKFKLDLEAALAARAKLATKPSRVDQDPILKAPTCILKKQSIQNMQNAQKEIDSDGQNVKNTTTDETNSEISNQSSFCLFYPFRRIFGGLKKVKKPAVSDYKARRKLSAMQRSDLMAKFEDRTGMVEKHNQCVNKFKKSSSESPELSPAENVNEEVPVIPFSKTKFRRSFRKFCRQISKDFKDEETKVGNGDDLLEDEAAIYENLDRAMKSYIGLISKMSSNKRNSRSNRMSSTEETPNSPSKLSTLSREILKEFDPNADSHMNKLFPNQNSHMVWIEKLRVFFETTAEINNFECLTDEESEDDSDYSEMQYDSK